jgi:hypothetical protein
MAHTHGTTFGSGVLYIGNLTDSTIERYDATTGAFLGASAPDAGLTTASSVVFGPDGLVYVTNISPGGLNSYDAVVGAHVATLDPGGPFTATWGLVINGGIIYVGYKDVGAIRKYDLVTGTLIGDFVPDGGDLLELDFCAASMRHPHRAYISDRPGDRLETATPCLITRSSRSAPRTGRKSRRHRAGRAQLRDDIAH